MDGLVEYAGLATDVMKDCVTKAGNTVKSEVKANAPVRTGQYKKGWAVKKQKETANSLELVVHNKKRYQLTHLLENGHAKRGGEGAGIPPYRPCGTGWHPGTGGRD